MRSRSIAALFFAALVASAVPRAARAEPADPVDEPAPPASAPKSPKDEALARYQRGLELHEEGDHAAALGEFRRAYELSPAYKVLFNIGQLCFQLQDYACASQSFQQYLHDGKSGISSQRRADVEADLRKLSLRVASLEIVTAFPGALVFVDEVPVGRTPLAEPVLVNPGRRRVRAVLEGHAPGARALDVGGTDAIRVELDLPLLVDPAASARASVLTRRVPPTMTTYSWGGVAVAGAAAATATVTGLLALNASTKLHRLDFAGDTPSAEAHSLSTQVKTFSLTSDIAIGVSVVTLAATLAITFLRGATTEEIPPPRVGFDLSGARINF